MFNHESLFENGGRRESSASRERAEISELGASHSGGAEKKRLKVVGDVRTGAELGRQGVPDKIYGNRLPKEVRDDQRFRGLWPKEVEIQTKNRGKKRRNQTSQHAG